MTRSGRAPEIPAEEEAMMFRKKKTLLEKASDYVDHQVRPQVESALATTLDAVEDFYENTARPALADARDKATPVLADARDKARDKASPYVAEARDRTTSALHDARDNAASALHDARDTAAAKAKDARSAGESSLLDAKSRAAFLAAQAKDSAASRAGDLAAQAKETADARVAQLRGEPQKKKGSTLRKVALFALLAGAVGFVARKLQSGGQQDNWQSSYVPTPAPTPAPKPAPAPAAVADDAGAAGPDEALSDLAEKPHSVSTPDDPAEVIDVVEGEHKK